MPDRESISEKNKSRGFTLIELMVVMAIIAILAAVGVVVYSTAQKSGRISKRVQDLQAFKTALELYKGANGNYPPAATAGTFACVGNGSGGGPLAVLVPDYMPVLPADPLDGGNAGGTYCYEYTSNGTTASTATEYKLRTKGSLYGSTGEMNTAAFDQQQALLDLARDGTANCTLQSGTGINHTGWAIYSGGAATCAYNTPP